MQFQKIVCVDQVGLMGWGMEELQTLSTARVVGYSNLPANNSQTIARIADADCVLVSWNTQIGVDVLRSSPQLA